MSTVGGLKRVGKWYYAAFIPTFAVGVLLAKVLDAEPHSRKDGVLLIGSVAGVFGGYLNARAGSLETEGDGDE